MVHTNDVYHKLVEDKAWLANKVLDRWYITEHVKWWRRVLDAGWHSHLPFHAKVLIRTMKQSFNMISPISYKEPP